MCDPPRRQPGQSGDDDSPPPLEELVPQYTRLFIGDVYQFPVDLREQDRLDLLHTLFKMKFGEKVRTERAASSVDDNVLDIGCGTGFLALTLGDEMINQDGRGKVVGVDLTMTQPHNIPTPCRFIRADVEAGAKWTGELVSCGPYDTIFCRLMRGAIFDWPRLFQNIFDNLTPGSGIFEHVEFDWQFRKENGPLGPGLAEWSRVVGDLMEKHGASIRFDAGVVEAQLRQTGFVDIEKECVPVPLSTWACRRDLRELSTWFNVIADLSLVSMALRPYCNQKISEGVDPGRVQEEFEVWIGHIMPEVKSMKYTEGVYCNLHVFTARRP